MTISNGVFFYFSTSIWIFSLCDHSHNLYVLASLIVYMLFALFCFGHMSVLFC